MTGEGVPQFEGETGANFGTGDLLKQKERSNAYALIIGAVPQGDNFLVVTGKLADSASTREEGGNTGQAGQANSSSIKDSLLDGSMRFVKESGVFGISRENLAKGYTVFIQDYSER